jgi:hypothetical protein
MSVTFRDLVDCGRLILLRRPQSTHNICASAHSLRLHLHSGDVRTTSRVPQIGVFLHAGS